MKFILRVTSSNEYSNGDCDYAVVDLTEELAKKIAARHKLLLDLREKDPDLGELQYTGTEVRFYRAHDNEDLYPEPFAELVKAVYYDCEDHREIPNNLDLAFLEAEEAPDSHPEYEHIHYVNRSDCLVIWPTYFFWRLYTEIGNVETIGLEYDILSKLI